MPNKENGIDEALRASAHVGPARAISRFGTDVLTAFILGFEIQARIAEAIHPDRFAGG